MKQASSISSEILDRENSSSTQIHISSQDAEAVISLLLSKQISFQAAYLVSKTENTCTVDIIDKRTTNFFYPISFYYQTKRDKIEKIHAEYIQNFPQELSPSEDAIAFSLGMTVGRFRTAFKAMYGKSFYQIYLDKRMEYAKQLLCEGFNCREVSTAVGYGKNSAIKFNKMFQKYYGITPRKYQLQLDN